MRHALVDKRVAGIIRWLERLKQSYSSGAMENALIEAECAKADLEILRADVWNKISTFSDLNEPIETKRNKIFGNIINFSKIGFLTLIIILTAVFPISREPFAEQSTRIIEEDKTQLVLAEPVQIIYEEPVAKLANLKTQETYKAAKNDVQKTQKNQSKIQAVQTAPKTQKKQAVENVEKNERIEKAEKIEKIEKKVAYEELFSLMQTGQRALKNNNSVVKISK